MNIKSIAEKLQLKYDTKDPIIIAEKMGMSVVFEQLGSIRGFYQHCFRHKILHINCDLDEYQQRITAAHELGHAILHPNVNTPFLREKTLFSVNKLEKEANQFAVNLLYSDADMYEYLEYSISQISAWLGLPEYLVEYRIKQLPNRDDLNIYF